MDSSGWAIKIYHRRAQKSKLSCSASRYRTATIARQAGGSLAQTQTTKPKKKPQSLQTEAFSLAPAAGFEPATLSLTATCSTAELRRNT